MIVLLSPQSARGDLNVTSEKDDWPPTAKYPRITLTHPSQKVPSLVPFTSIVENENES